MAITLKKKNFAKGELSADLAIDGSSLTLATNQGLLFPDTGVGNPFRAVLWDASDNSPFADTLREIIECYRSSGDTFTITSRSSESTTAKAWPTGSHFMLSLTAGVLEEIETAITTESLWDRATTVLSPQNAGDSIANISTYNNLTITAGASSVLDIAASKTINVDYDFSVTGGAVGIVGNGTGNTISFPLGVDTLVGQASVDTLTGLKTLQHNNIVVTSHDGLVFTNDTAATAAVPVQMSPRQRFRGNVWNTTATAANNTSDAFIELLPVSGTTPSWLLKWGAILNGGSATYPMTLSNLGALTTLSTINGLTITANGTNTLNITAGKTLTVQDNVTITGALGTGAYATIANYATLATPVFTSKITCGVAAGTTGSIELVGTTSGVVTLTVAAEAGTYTLTLPTSDGAENQFLQTNGSGVLTWAAGGAGANTALSNLAAVAISETLVSDTDNTDALGTTAIAWSDLFLGSGAVITFNSAPSTADVTITHSANLLTLAGGDLAISNLTASEIVATDASKNLVSLAVATYPSLAELAYVKGVTSAIQTQIGNKANSANPTFTGTVTLGDNCRIDLTLPTADTYCTGPTTDSFASGYSSAVGDLVFFGTGGKWLEADADAIATCGTLLGIALEAKADTEAMKVALPGSMVRLDAWNWNVGKCLYASETLGGISESIPTGADGVVKVVGVSISADAIYFYPSQDHSTTVA